MNIEQRLTALEGSVRVWRCIALTIAVIFGVVFSIHNFTGPKVQGMSMVRADDAVHGSLDRLRVRKLELVNDQDQLVGQLSSTKSGAILLLGNVQDHMVAVYSNPTSSSIYLGFGNQPRIELTESHDDAYCRLCGQTGTSFVSNDGLSISPPDLAKRHQREELQKKTEEGQAMTRDDWKQTGEPPAIAVGIAPKINSGFIEVYNPLGKRVVALQASKSNAGGILVYDANGEHSKVIAGGP